MQQAKKLWYGACFVRLQLQLELQNDLISSPSRRLAMLDPHMEQRKTRSRRVSFLPPRGSHSEHIRGLGRRGAIGRAVSRCPRFGPSRPRDELLSFGISSCFRFA